MPSLKIGSLSLSNKLILAPMFKVTDVAFRMLCRDQGACLAFAEMTNAQAVTRNPKVVQQAGLSAPGEKPFGIQLAAQDPLVLTQSIEALEPYADLFDLNLGCPSDRTRESGIGSALLSDPAKIQELVKAMRKATSKPITAKIRLPTNPKDALQIAELIESAGADAITVHARTVSQRHAGEIDTALVAQIKDRLSIPVINNGGIWNLETYRRILDATHCDGVMLARSAIGNPGIFAELLGKKPISRIVGLEKYLEYCEKYGFLHIGRIKNQCLTFAAHYPGSLKNKFQKAKTMDELRAITQELAIAKPLIND